ncbi:MAG: glycosyltransferase [Lyngbya sp. HA4199-MV5]|jgi:glycosyltransferase involved in cell wall biosynthesis|nr:glycosyltransferase [Lyngbya sp. HA4199-MV5]
MTPADSVSAFIHLLQTRKWAVYSTDEPSVPVVSIISSFFNAHQYFEETFQSVINQTFQNFEWIMVDDCSSDPAAIALFQRLPTKSSKIKTLQHDVNQGLSAGRNTAIAHAQGKYFFFIDLDDLIDPTYIEKCVLFLETHPDFSIVNSYSVGFQAQEYWWHHEFDQPARFIEQNWVTGRLLYRKSDFDRLGGFDADLKVYGDWERWLKAIVNGQKGWTIPEYLDCYRRTDSGLLATLLNDPIENKREIDVIQDRYRTFFVRDRFHPFAIHSRRFDSQTIQSAIAVKKPLKRYSTHKRVLCFFPFLEVGGADRFNLDLLTLLAERGYEFTIATTLKSNHRWHQHFYAVTPDIFHLPNFLDDQHWLSFTRYILESRQIDVVLISNCYVAYYFLPLLRPAFPNVAFVDFTHTIDPGWRGNGYPRLSCQFSQWLDYQVVTSKFLATVYQRAIDPEKLRVCYTNIDAERWVRDRQKRQQLRSTLNLADETVVLLFPARLVEQKRPLFLVDLVKALSVHTASIAVIVIGDGELLPDLTAKISHLKLEPYVHLLPPAAPAEMLAFYSAADILLLPSAYEGVSLSIYEAMAMQLPVVASEVGGQAELVTPGTGFLVAKGKGDEQEVQAYLQVLLPLIQSQSLRQQVGDHARQRIVESFSLARMADQMEAIFEEAIALCQTKPNVEVEWAIAAEMLLMALEYLHQEQSFGNLWQEKRWLERERDQLRQEKQRLEAERHELAWKKRAMETSKFWQLRKRWFKLKRWLRFTQEEEI